MRWRDPPKPEHNSKRIVRRFIWYPIQLNGEWRWLEMSHILQRYTAFGWTSTDWATKVQMENQDEVETS